MRHVLLSPVFAIVAALGFCLLTTTTSDAVASRAPSDTIAKEPAKPDKPVKKSDQPASANGASTIDKSSSKNGKSNSEEKAKPETTKKTNGSNTKHRDEDHDGASAAKKVDAEPKSSDKAKAKEKRKTYKIEPKRFKIDLSLDGTFVASKTAEVPLRPDSWSDYEIVDVVELGAKVHKSEVLFKFDSEKIDDAIEDLELQQHLNELAIMKSEDELPRMEQTLKMEFEDADRSQREANEDFKRYNELERPMAVKSAEFLVKYYNFNLDYEKDELNQLEKMYKADDLTEETEEIVLKRQRNAVEFARFSLENAKLTSDEMLKIRLPRFDIQMKETLERTALAKARAKMALSLDLSRARYELEQRRKARTKSLEKHTKLLADRDLMELKSPADGVVYYGQCVDGRWANTASLVKKYQPHNNVSGGSVLMTIVEQRPLYITSMLEEGKRPDVSDGQKVKVALPSEDGNRLGGNVKSISPIPVSSGKFEINFDVNQDEIPAWIVAGMSCKVSVTTYDKADAIVVPKKAVHDDEYDPDQHYIWLVDADEPTAEPQRRNVKLGERKDDDVEIVKGLKKGDVISLDDEEETKHGKDKEE